MISDVDIDDWDKDIQVRYINDNPDGSADVVLHLSHRGVAAMIQVGFLAILKERIKDDTTGKTGL
jgi:hypothetical protein